jgi:aminopeptidase-like protein
VPDAWDANEAYIEDRLGNRLIDYKNNPLHLAAYSTAFTGNVSKEELRKHLLWSEILPDAIPYCYRYYTKNWQFCVAKNDLVRFTDDEYHVHIDVDRRPGHMLLGDFFLPG